MAETEKITLNVPPMDLANVDLLVEQGFYQNRADFFKRAIGTELGSKQELLQTLVDQHVKSKKGKMSVGIEWLTEQELDEAITAGTQSQYTVFGMLIIPETIPLAKLQQALASIKVYGSVRASKTVKQAFNL